MHVRGPELNNMQKMIDGIRLNVEHVNYTAHRETGEPCLIFQYTDKTYRIIRLTEEERETLKSLSDFIAENYNNSLLSQILKEKVDLFDAVLNNAIKKELTLAQYDPDYFKQGGKS